MQRPHRMSDAFHKFLQKKLRVSRCVNLSSRLWNERRELGQVLFWHVAQSIQGRRCDAPEEYRKDFVEAE